MGRLQCVLGGGVRGQRVEEHPQRAPGKYQESIAVVDIAIARCASQVRVRARARARARRRAGSRPSSGIASTVSTFTFGVGCGVATARRTSGCGVRSWRHRNVHSHPSGEGSPLEVQRAAQHPPSEEAGQPSCGASGREAALNRRQHGYACSAGLDEEHACLVRSEVGVKVRVMVGVGVGVRVRVRVRVRVSRLEEEQARHS